MKRKSLMFMVLAITIVFTACTKQDDPLSPELTPIEPKDSLTKEMEDRVLILVDDPVGDNTGIIDVTRMVMTFSSVSGNYTIVLVASPANPFVASFRVNINLYNQDTGTTNQNPSFFQEVGNNLNLSVPTTVLTFTGTNSRLLAWNVGDRVFTNSLAGTGNPAGTSLFRSAVIIPPFTFLTNEDTIAFEDLAQPALVSTKTVDTDY